MQRVFGRNAQGKEGLMAPARFIVLLFALSLASLPANAARHALLVGCNNGGPSVDPLRWAEKDAQRFATVLQELGGFLPANVTTLRAPDSAALERELHKVALVLRSSSAPGNDLFLLYYSGHADGKDLLLGEGRLPLEKLRSLLDSLPTGIRIGVFDACQSGAIAAFKGGKRAEPFYLADPPKVQGQVIIASATPTQRAQESESLKSSLFTFHWLTGLRGSADFSGDRRVTLDEAYRYAYRKTVEISTLAAGEAQHPVYRFALQGRGDITLTDLTDRTGGIVFDPTCEGSFLVLSDVYTDIFADFSKKKGGEWFVALEPGSYRVINAFDREVGMRNVEIPTAGKTVGFTSSMLLPIERSLNRGKGPAGSPVDTAGPATTRPLSLWTCGVGVGALTSARPDAPERAMRVVVTGSLLYYVNDRCDLFLDLRYPGHGTDAGVALGADLRGSSGPLRPAAGMGFGGFHLDTEATIVPAVTAHAGFVTDITNRLQLSVRAPYLLFFRNAGAEQCFGLELRLLVTGKYRSVKALR